jgi:hypothetical protein
MIIGKVKSSRLSWRILLTEGEAEITASDSYQYFSYIVARTNFIIKLIHPQDL